jgi:hypothetical protein
VVAEETIILSARTSVTVVAEEAEALLQTVGETLAQVVVVLVATPEMVEMAH